MICFKNLLISYCLDFQNLLKERILAVEQWKDDARRLNKRNTMEMHVHMAHMFRVATEQALLPAEQRTATPESICKDLGVEIGKFETEPYIEIMKSKIEISYPKHIVELIRTRKAAARAQAGSSNVRAEPMSVTPDPTLRPNFVPATETAQESSTTPAIETTPSNLALGK